MPHPESNAHHVAKTVFYTQDIFNGFNPSFTKDDLGFVRPGISYTVKTGHQSKAVRKGELLIYAQLLIQ